MKINWLRFYHVYVCWDRSKNYVSRSELIGKALRISWALYWKHTYMGHHRDIMLRRGDINSLKFLSNFPAGFPWCDTESGHLKPSRRITLKCILMRKMAQIIRWHSHFFFKNLILTPVVWQSIKLDLMDRFENIKTYSLTWLLIRRRQYAIYIWFINS